MNLRLAAHGPASGRLRWFAFVSGTGYRARVVEPSLELSRLDCPLDLVYKKCFEDKETCFQYLSTKIDDIGSKIQALRLLSAPQVV